MALLEKQKKGRAKPLGQVHCCPTLELSVSPCLSTRLDQQWLPRLPVRMHVGVLCGDPGDELLWTVRLVSARGTRVPARRVRGFGLFFIPEKQDFISFAFQALILEFLTFHHLLKNLNATFLNHFNLIYLI